MTSLHELRRALQAPPAAEFGGLHVGEIMARGRRVRRWRRVLATGGCAGLAAALAAVGVGVSQLGPRPAAARRTATGTALVAYDGRQPPGYKVAEVPRGWVIQGGNAYALVLAPKEDENTNISNFIGKLVVMLQSRNAHGPGPGTPQRVAGRPGRFDVQDHTEILTYKDAAGAWVVTQAPKSLGWDSARLAQFAAGVQVLSNAQHPLG
jgi:hypothetical protein